MAAKNVLLARITCCFAHAPMDTVSRVVAQRCRTDTLFPMLKVKLLAPGAVVPTVAHPGEDLGYDIYAAGAARIAAHSHAQVSTGIAIEILSASDKPMGGLLRDRSSVAARRLIIVAGVIDAGYRGEIKVLMENLGEQEIVIAVGDKIANLLPYPVLTGEVKIVPDLTESSRETGGFGSSGK